MNLFECIVLTVVLWWVIGFISIYVGVRILEETPSRGHAIVLSFLGLFVTIIITILLIGKLGEHPFFKKPLYERRRIYTHED